MDTISLVDDKLLVRTIVNREGKVVIGMQFNHFIIHVREHDSEVILSIREPLARTEFNVYRIRRY